jgi:hypothetical protein
LRGGGLRIESVAMKSASDPNNVSDGDEMAATGDRHFARGGES